jgi:hypothetical protein
MQTNAGVNENDNFTSKPREKVQIVWKKVNKITFRYVLFL